MLTLLVLIILKLLCWIKKEINVRIFDDYRRCGAIGRTSPKVDSPTQL